MRKPSFLAGFFLALVLVSFPELSSPRLYAGGGGEKENETAVAEAKNGEPGAAEQAPPREKIDAYFFYDELCEQCRTDEEKFTSILQEKLPLAERNQYPNSINIINIYKAAGSAMYAAVTDELGLDREILGMPLLIMGGRIFQGYESIGANIREAYLTAAEDLYVNKKPYNPKTKKTGGNLFEDYPVDPGAVTLVYFYRITCPECAEVTPAINALPAAVSVNGAERPLNIIRINTRSGNNGERISAFFDAWQVPDKDRMVPIVFFKDSYLAGRDNILSGLRQNLTETEGQWKLLPERRAGQEGM